MAQTLPTYVYTSKYLFQHIRLLNLDIHIWLEMVLLQPVKLTIILFCVHNSNPQIDVYKYLYKSNVMNACLPIR